MEAIQTRTLLFSRESKGKMTEILLLVSIALTPFEIASPCQVEPPRTADESFHPEIERPAYPKGAGPVVLIDEAHNNFHTAGGTYKPFAALLERDGYVVKPLNSGLTAESLGACGVLVISDAMPLEDGGSPFTESEIKAVYDWVKSGGALFLITDHFLIVVQPCYHTQSLRSVHAHCDCSVIR